MSSSEIARTLLFDLWPALLIFNIHQQSGRSSPKHYVLFWLFLSIEYLLVFSIHPKTALYVFAVFTFAHVFAYLLQWFSQSENKNEGGSHRVCTESVTWSVFRDSLQVLFGPVACLGLLLILLAMRLLLAWLLGIST